MPESVAGQHGHDRLWDVAVALLLGFALSEQEAWPLLLEFSDRCRPPWSENELRHKVEDALTKSRLPLGYLLTEESEEPGQGLAALYQEAIRTPLTLPWGVGRGWKLRRRLRELARLCQLLQERAGAHPFAIGCDRAGELFGVRKQVTARWLKILVRDGVLTMARNYSRQYRRTRRYRYVLGNAG
jgi:hypothetical protein